jgi:hypothetical protein
MGGRLLRRQWWPYLLLVAIPAATFILPDLFGGHLLMAGDNLQQNYPLHVLVGSMFAHGHLPFWDPYIFSGSPLLADFNAGAFYPLVGLFVLLPDRVAWVALEVILYSAIGIGMYVYLRALSLNLWPAMVAAITFTCSGVVLTQVNHVDMAEGFVALPWMLLAVLHIVRDGRWRWSILLSVGLCVVILGGAPEAMLDETILVIVYALVSVLGSRTNVWQVLSRLVAGAALGLSLAAVQWLPGLNAIAHSQRSGLGGSFAASGSYPTRDLLLGLVPYLYGGYQYLGEAKFFSHYNLPEVGIYMGILPVIAVLTLLRPSWPSRLPRPDRRTWYIVGGVALLLALGANTPLEHVVSAIPLYGHQRLQSRNMIGVSAAICVLFAGWLDRRPEAMTSHGASDRLLGFLPTAAVLGLTIWAFASPNSLIRDLAQTDPSRTYVHAVREACLIALLFCVSAGAVVLIRSVARPRLWMSAVVLLMAADIGLVAGTSQLLITPSNSVIGGTTGVEEAVASHLPPGGRFDLFDPQGYTGPPYGIDGMTDFNILDRLPSVGGYASIVNGRYSNVTETHTGGDLNLAALENGQLAELGLQELVTVPEYFMLPIAFTSTTPSGVRQVQEARGANDVLSSGYSTNYHDVDYPSYPTTRPGVSAGRSDAWFFGTSTDPTQAGLLLDSGTPEAVVRFGKVNGSHPTSWGPAVLVPAGAHRVTGSLPSGTSDGLKMQVLFGSISAHQATIEVGAQNYELDGSLSQSIQPGTWRWRGSFQPFSFFTLSHPIPAVHTIAKGSTAPHVHVISTNANGETVRLSSETPERLVRDVAWDAGWHALISVNGGPDHQVEIADYQLVQEVRLPVGQIQITFQYRPKHILLATLITLGGLAVVLLAGVTAMGQRIRRRPLRSVVHVPSRLGLPHDD